MAETMQGLKRTVYCGQVTEAMVGKEVVVCGWVQRARDKGQLVFIDLRDRTGIVQLAFNADTPEALRKKAASVHSEYVLMARGILKKRESVNPDLPTGTVEVDVEELRILAKAETPPFEIVDNTAVREELRLKYRYLDLRRGEMQRNILMRHKIVKAAHDYYDDNGFLEIETPDLIKSTPEGARDYLVPSRVQNGKFYALPQSPQLYKQLLMLSGYDRYMQIARCFRDEDLRADRQPEFTQIDIEMSFVDEDDVMAVNEGFIKYVFKQVLDREIQTPFRRMTYREAMERYGIDKPDTRFGLELVNLTDLAAGCGFSVFAKAAETGAVRGINVKGGADRFSRKEIDKLTEFVKGNKAGGLAYTKLGGESESSSYEKFLTPEQTAAIRQRMGAEKGDLLLIVADAKKYIVFDALGALRNELARHLGLIQPGTFDLLWIIEFPMFEYSEEEGRYMAKHHPFTCPMLEDMAIIESDKENCRARAYDMVMNGTEVGGGSIRINDPDLQREVFRALGFTPEEAERKFGFLINAFKYGAPPHGGMAFGLDRLVMLMLGKDTIKDVIAFPKVQNASELMTGCPAEVSAKDLDILGVSIKE